MNALRRLKSVVETPTGTVGEQAQALMVRVARGDESAFAQLYDLVAPTVYGVVLRVLRDPAQSEEVAQEVMVELWKLASRYDPRQAGVHSWAATLAHRRAVDRVRSQQSSRDRDDRAGRLEPTITDSVADDVVNRLDSERVNRALAQLTPLQRETVMLAYFGGHTYREVAVLLGVPEGTVKTRIRDGLIRLRDTMGVSS